MQVGVRANRFERDQEKSLFTTLRAASQSRLHMGLGKGMCF